MRKLLFATSAAVLSVAGFSGVANAYPVPTPPTTEQAQLPPGSIPILPEPALPRTGGNIDDSLVLGASVVALGAGFVLVTRRRKRPAEV